MAKARFGLPGVIDGARGRSNPSTTSSEIPMVMNEETSPVAGEDELEEIPEENISPFLDEEEDAVTEKVEKESIVGSPEWFAEKAKREAYEVNTRRRQRWGMEIFVRDLFGAELLAKFGPEKIAKVLERLTAEAKAGKSKSIHEITQLQLVSLLCDDTIAATVFFREAADNLKRQVDEFDDDKKMSPRNPNHRGHLDWKAKEAQRYAKRMETQILFEKLGLGEYHLKAKDGYERLHSHELHLLEVFNEASADKPADYTPFIEQFTGGMSGFDAETIMGKSEERVEASRTSLMETVRTFNEQVARVGLAAAEVAEEKYRAKLRELEEQLKKMEQRHEALTEGPEALAEEGQVAWRTEIELVKKAYEKTAEKYDAIIVEALTPWHEARQKIEMMQGLAEARI